MREREARDTGPRGPRRARIGVPGSQFRCRRYLLFRCAGAKTKSVATTIYTSVSHRPTPFAKNARIYSFIPSAQWWNMSIVTTRPTSLILGSNLSRLDLMGSGFRKQYMCRPVACCVHNRNTKSKYQTIPHGVYKRYQAGLSTLELDNFESKFCAYGMICETS